MTDQLPMSDLITAADDDTHQRRAVKPSWFEPCSTEGCDISAWVTEDTEGPFCCLLCELERKGRP